jgi:hypothetical protein
MIPKAKRRSGSGVLPVIEHNAAEIDIGATQISVAIPADRDREPVQCFPTFTVNLERLADWPTPINVCNCQRARQV